MEERSNILCCCALKLFCFLKKSPLKAIIEWVCIAVGLLDHAIAGNIKHLNKKKKIAAYISFAIDWWWQVTLDVTVAVLG